jgi:trans-2,3-dihydro-3-hydroxyanthranilate isomerase
VSVLRFHTLDVFTDRRYGGNPLSVVFGGESLDEREMQIIAREFNLSETVFVLAATDVGATHRVRIFTPGRELPFAGHPTIGTAILLSQLGEARPTASGSLVVLEEKVGLVPVTIRMENRDVPFAQLTSARLPEQGPPAPDAAALADALSLDPTDVLATAEERPEAWSAGVPYLMVPLRDRGALGRASLSEDRWRRTLRQHWSPDVYVFCRDPELSGSAIRARMFAPEFGIVEDPATGSAAVALAGYLGARAAGPDGTQTWIVEQGFEMGRPSLLYLEADMSDGTIGAVRLGGTAVRVLEGTLPL